VLLAKLGVRNGTEIPDDGTSHAIGFHLPNFKRDLFEIDVTVWLCPKPEGRASMDGLRKVSLENSPCKGEAAISNVTTTSSGHPWDDLLIMLLFDFDQCRSLGGCFDRDDGIADILFLL